MTLLFVDEPRRVNRVPGHVSVWAAFDTVLVIIRLRTFANGVFVCFEEDVLSSNGPHDTILAFDAALVVRIVFLSTNYYKDVLTKGNDAAAANGGLLFNLRVEGEDQFWGV